MKKVLEGVFQGWWSSHYGHYQRVFTVSNPGPAPHTETITSVMAFVAQELEQVAPGIQVRITVETL